MNLPGLTSRTDYRLSTRQIITVLWVGCLVYSTMIIALILLNRLGLPIDFSHLLHTIFVSFGVILLGWMGRTMTSRHFFFAQKRANSAASGWSGGTDWSGGAFLLILVSVSFYQRGIWIIAIMLGLLIMSLLFARAFHRAGVSTLPGFLAWRFPESGAGLLAIPASSIVLLLLAIAEFEVARSTMAIIDSVNAGQLTWFILFLAVVPAVLGGWMSLVFLNIVLALWLAISVLLPTLMLGLVPTPRLIYPTHPKSVSHEAQRTQSFVSDNVLRNLWAPMLLAKRLWSVHVTPKQGRRTTGTPSSARPLVVWCGLTGENAKTGKVMLLTAQLSTEKSAIPVIK